MTDRQPDDIEYQMVENPGVEMIRVMNDGRCFISWGQVEKALSDPSVDPMALAVARLLISVRDNTWRPMYEADADVDAPKTKQ